MDLSVLRRNRWAVVIGAAVGLLTGFAGMSVPPGEEFRFVHLVGAMAGAVGGGATGALLADEGIVADASVGMVADLVSSGVVFLLVFVGLLFPMTPSDAAVLSPFMLLGGFVIAWPIAVVSLCIAGVSGVLASVGKRVVAGHTRG